MHPDKKKLIDALDLAWGLIANAGGGDWKKESPEWQEAAAKWRDEHFHPNLPVPMKQRAREAYARYGAVTDFKNFRGDPMPAFDELPEKIQTAWQAAVNIPEVNE